MGYRHHDPLESRTFKYKNPHLEFYCPLCGTQRAISAKPHLNALNFFQMVLITIALTACFYPLMEWKGVFLFFLVWALFEGALRLNFRKEVPCPHCGFDASWYKKDVIMAREKVDRFWSNHKKVFVDGPQNVDELESSEQAPAPEPANTQKTEDNPVNF